MTLAILIVGIATLCTFLALDRKPLDDSRDDGPHGDCVALPQDFVSFHHSELGHE